MTDGDDGTAWPWGELGLTPPAEPRAVRRAYAARLKQTRPEDDPEGFARLRTAFEAALALAEGGAETVGASPPLQSAPALVTETPEPLPPPSDPATLAAVRGAVERRDVVVAAQVLSAARRIGTLGLADLLSLSDRLMHLLATDRDLPSQTVTEAANTLGWDGRPTVPRTPLLDRLLSRMAAERWQAGLRERAKAPRRLLGDGWPEAARLLAGQGAARRFWILPPGPALRRALAEYHYYAPVLPHGFDAERVATAERIARHPWGRAAGPVRSIIQFLACCVLPFDNWRGGLLGRRAVMATFVLLRFVWSMAGVAALIVLVGLGLPWLQAHLPLRGGASPEELVVQLRQRANRGDAQAAYTLGTTFAGGHGVERDPATAAYWFERALPGIPAAATRLGELDEASQNRVARLATARDRYRWAADHGDAAGQLHLARLLAAGMGGPADPAEAFRWRLHAARQGDLAGFVAVGDALLAGTGVAPDATRALAWLLAAARAGDAGAMATAASLFVDGRGTVPAPADAYRWSLLALRLGRWDGPDQAVLRALRDQVGDQLDPRRRAELEDEAKTWTPEPLKTPE